MLGKFMHNSFEIQKTSFGTIIDYERGYGLNAQGLIQEDDWQDLLNKKMNSITKNNKDLTRNDLNTIFANNSNSYVMKNLAQNIENLRDLNGNIIDFNALSFSWQNLIISFLQEPLEQTLSYGTKAFLNNIKIDTNNNELYIQADIHTIDGQVLSAAAEFSSKPIDTQKYQYSIFEHTKQNQIHKFSFLSSKILNTQARKELIDNIKNASTKELENFEENIEIAIFPNAIENALVKFSLYENSELKLNYNKALENTKMPTKHEKTDTKTLSLLNIFWTNIRADLEKFKDFNNIKINEKTLFQSKKIKNHSMLLKNWLKII